MRIPRLMIVGTSSGCGKTTVTCALLKVLENRGILVKSFKSGPDYIDPMFHQKVLKTDSGNLDLFFYDSTRLLTAFLEQAGGYDIAVIEGAMGFYDGIALTTEASAWQLAQVTQCPVLLVVDGQGSGFSIAAVVKGFLQLRSPSVIRGVILNRVSPMLYPRLKAAVEAECGVPVVGYLPKLPQCSLESRHLGLVTADEVKNLKDKIEILGQEAEKGMELERLLSTASAAPELPLQESDAILPVDGEPVVAVAQDEAFCFCYHDTLKLMKRMGGKIVFFSPLRDAKLPDCDAIYLCGGYPELYAEELFKNNMLKQQIRDAVLGGVPTIAECGGFLYLQARLKTREGDCYPMCGVFSGTGYPTNRLQRFGYVTLTAQKETLLCDRGAALKAHEFHYWDVDDGGADYLAQKPMSDRSWHCCYASDTLYAGFPHLALFAHPEAVCRFLTAAVHRREANKDDNK